MCNFFSCIVTENGDALFDPMSDSHETIISNNAKNYDLSDDTADPTELKFARVEILPPNGDVFQPVDKWFFTIDQRITPAWWSEFHKKQAYDCLNTFLNSALLKGKKIQELSTGRYWVKDCRIETLRGNVLIVKLESSQIREMWGSSQIREMWGSSQVGVMRESSQVGEMWESSQVGVYSEKALFKLKEKAIALLCFSEYPKIIVANENIVKNIVIEVQKTDETKQSTGKNTKG